MKLKKFISKNSDLNTQTAKAVIWWALIGSALILVLDKSECQFLEKKLLHYQYKQLYITILCSPKQYITPFRVSFIGKMRTENIIAGEIFICDQCIIPLIVRKCYYTFAKT